MVISDIPSSSRAWAPKALSPRGAGPLALARFPIDATLYVDIGKFIEFKFRVLAQLLAFARKVRLFGVGLRAD